MYSKIVFLTRKNYFYKNFNLSDTFTSRIYLIFFHLSFVLVTLNKNDNYKEDSQQIFDFFFKQIEVNFRELGYGDTYVNKNMKNLIKLFYEILFQCQNWNKLDNYNKNHLLLKFFENRSNNKILTGKLINYFDEFSIFVEDIPLYSLIKGVFNFAYRG